LEHRIKEIEKTLEGHMAVIKEATGEATPEVIDPDQFDHA